LRYRQNLVDHAPPKQEKHNVCFLKKLPGAPHESPGAKGFQTAWRGTRAARRQAPLMPLFIQVSPSGTTLIAKRYMLQFSTSFVAIA